MEKSLTETVNMDFLKALVKNINTNISEDLHFSLTPSQVKASPHPHWLVLVLLSSGIFF